MLGSMVHPTGFAGLMIQRGRVRCRSPGKKIAERPVAAVSSLDEASQSSHELLKCSQHRDLLIPKQNPESRGEISEDSTLYRVEIDPDLRWFRLSAVVDCVVLGRPCHITVMGSLGWQNSERDQYHRLSTVLKTFIHKRCCKNCRIIRRSAKAGGHTLTI